MSSDILNPTIAASRRFRVSTFRAIAYWVVSAPILLETIVGSEWDLARISYVREVFGTPRISAGSADDPRRRETAGRCSVAGSGISPNQGVGVRGR